MIVCKNILALEASTPLCITEDFDEAKYLASLFKSKYPIKPLSSKFFYFYDIDPTLLPQSDKIFQQFRLKMSDVNYDRGQEAQRIIFKKAYYELRGT